MIGKTTPNDATANDDDIKLRIPSHSGNIEVDMNRVVNLFVGSTNFDCIFRVIRKQLFMNNRPNILITIWAEVGEFVRQF